MYYSTITAVLLSGAALAAAIPTDLEARDCTIEYPTTLLQLLQDDPTHNTGNHDYVYTAQGEGKTDQWVTEVQFTKIPAGSYGCQLEMFFPANYQVDVSGNNKIDVFSVDRDISLADTWENHPNPVSLVGTHDVDAQEPMPIVFGSFVCAPTMNFRLEIDGTGAGSVGFPQSDPTAGIRLRHNC